MNFLSRFDHKEALRCISEIGKTIKKNVKEWRLIEVSLTGNTRHNTSYIAHKLLEYFHDREGFLFACNSKEIIGLVHIGGNADIRTLSSNIEQKMPAHSCTVLASEASEAGLASIQLQIGNLAEQPDSSPLLQTRRERKDNIIMVVEDDMFIRSVISGTFKPEAQVIELGNLGKVVETYLEELPDILFLDIHLPDGSGIKTLSKILTFDETAYAVIISSDSVKDNVVKARNTGARGFIAKTFTPEKIREYYDSCPTITRQQVLKN